MIELKYNDGGRYLAGYKGDTGDCVVRSIAIATGLPYKQVYKDLFDLAKTHGETRRDRLARRIRTKGGSPRNGSWRQVYKKYLEALGWQWVPTMKIGTGCQVHLDGSELPTGQLLVKVSKHLTFVEVDSNQNLTIYDTHDPSREGRRCVYGYFIKK